MRRYLIAMLVVAVASVAARADWQPGDGHKMHYAQLPDLSYTGMDVMSYPGYAVQVEVDPPLWQEVDPRKELADDWMCSASGAVTDIHIWGSWLFDEQPPEQPHPIFMLTIWPDVPAGAEPGSHSRPGDLWLWSQVFTPADYAVMPPIPTQGEQFFDPNANYGEGAIIGTDTICWQYNFDIDEVLAFRQEEGTIYWLSVMAYYPTEIDDGTGLMEQAPWRWGWKTSLDHFNDDAVFGDWTFDPGTGQWYDPVTWNELRYPMGHLFEGQSIDLAFVITPEPATMGLLGLGIVGLMARRRRRKA